MSRAQILADLLYAGWRPPTISDNAAERLLEDIRDVDKFHSNGDGLTLTARELHMLRMAARGQTAADIADGTGKTVHTVKHIQKIVRGKLGARNVTHAVALAIGQGLIEAPNE